MCMPPSVVTISAWAFRDCSSLVSVHIPESVTVIGPGAFRSCHLLESVNIPKAATNIAHDAFAGCASLGRVSAARARSNALPELDELRDARAREAAIRLSEKRAVLRGEFARTKGSSATSPRSSSGLSTRTPSTGDLRSHLATEELWTDMGDLHSQGAFELDCVLPVQPTLAESSVAGVEGRGKHSEDLAAVEPEHLGKLSNEQLRSQTLDAIQVIRRKMMEKQSLQKLQTTSGLTQTA